MDSFIPAKRRIMMKILSLGWGVQSFTIAAMSALGELEKVDYAIHADTTHESILTYQFAKRWTDWLENREVHVVTVSQYNPVVGKLYDKGYHIDIPAFSLHNGKSGQTHRQCTGHWKIEPMRRWIQAHRNGQPVEQWLGISLDEFQRMKDSSVKYIVNRWPLIEKRMTRQDCKTWLSSHRLEVPPKSSCTFCPYHNTAQWRRIKDTPEDWAEAVAVDESIRKVHPHYDLFIHPARKPIEQVDFRTMEEKGQLSLWDNECTGICGV
jgi:hypothetical protein